MSTARGTDQAKPEIALNRAGATVAGALDGFIREAPDWFAEARLDIASAYFNLGGYLLIADALDKPAEVRLLIGAEPVPPENRPRMLGPEPHDLAKAERSRLDTALAEHGRVIRTDRDMLGFDHDTDAGQRRLVDWLESGKVQVRRLTSRFLHGKAFLVGTRSHGVVAGSSNFTRAGLSTNEELNLGVYSPSAVDGVQEWFDDLWDEAEPYDLADLFRQRLQGHPPWLVYLRMLWERYRAELEEEAEGSEIGLTTFQKHGVWRAERILAEHNGVLIADEVGLGKTFLAGALIEQAAIKRRQRVLVIAPATLRDGPWKAFKAASNLPFELRSFDNLAADSRLTEGRSGSKLDSKIDEYAMVVVDEAHNLRNPATDRAKALRSLLSGSPPKQLVLLTATPVNNSLWDLYHQVGLFVRNDAAFAEIGIPSMREHFRSAEAVNPTDLTPDLLFDVLDAVAVRRTRPFIKRWYPNDTIPTDNGPEPIVFPTPRVLKVEYDFDSVLPGFFDDIAAALEPDGNPGDPGVLSLARYEPSRYRIDKTDEDDYERRIVGLLRSALLKRFESSPHAFASTCAGMADDCAAFVSLLDQGVVAKGGALRAWAEDSDDLDDWMDVHGEAADDAAGFDVDMLRDLVSADAALLRNLAGKAGSVTRDDDPNLTALADELAAIAEQADRDGTDGADLRNRRKVLIFSYFADTVEWIRGYLEHAVDTNPRLACYQGRVVALTGGHSSPGAKKKAVWGFAPQTADAPEGHDDDLFDILVCTDVLAEGVNLQQAQHVINYDLPWNPMRLVQRHGRIDRIGSHHDEVFVRCVFPDKRLDELLTLEERLQRKIRHAAASIGTPQVLPHMTGRDKTFTENRDEIEALRNEDPGLFERSGKEQSGVLSAEGFRQELRQAVDHGLRPMFEELPWGAGGCFTSDAVPEGRLGFVFCLRVADHPEPLYRYVEIDETGETGADNTVIWDSTLDCLSTARPYEGAPTADLVPTLPQAFGGWEQARAHVVDGWNWRADKANLEPRIPPAQHRALDLIRRHPPAGIAQERIDAALDALAVPYDDRTKRRIGEAAKTGDTPAEQALSVLETVEHHGLQAGPAPKPPPPITTDDVHLVCWQAILPA